MKKTFKIEKTETIDVIAEKCPFCGMDLNLSLENKTLYDDGKQGYSVVCKASNCEIAGPFRFLALDAVLAWNRRGGAS